MHVSSHDNPKLLTFRSGGWVLLMTGIVCAVLIAWAVAPAIMRIGEPAIGDGKTLDSYLFSLASPRVPFDQILPATLHREMVPAMIDPTSRSPIDAQSFNDPRYHKYMVPADLVIGVVINGHSRAYPIHVLNVHEIINDSLGSPAVPIAVTYSTLCDAVMVYDRRISDTRVAEFRHSGLVYNSNFLMFDRTQAASGAVDEPRIPVGGESLWSQLLGQPLTGPDAATGRTLRPLPYELIPWGDWLARHPDTTVIDRDMQFIRRYKDAAPTPYFNSTTLRFPVSPMPPDDVDLPLKTRVVVVPVGNQRRVYPLPLLASRAKTAAATGSPASWTDAWIDHAIRFELLGSGDALGVSVTITPPPPGDPPVFVHAFWFAWHAMHPDDELVRP